MHGLYIYLNKCNSLVCRLNRCFKRPSYNNLFCWIVRMFNIAYESKDEAFSQYCKFLLPKSACGLTLLPPPTKITMTVAAPEI